MDHTAFAVIPNMTILYKTLGKLETKLTRIKYRHRSELVIKRLHDGKKELHYYDGGKLEHEQLHNWLEKKYRDPELGFAYFALFAKIIRTVRKMYKVCRIHGYQLMYSCKSETSVSIYMNTRLKIQEIILPQDSYDDKKTKIKIEKYINWYILQQIITSRSSDRQLMPLDDLLSDLKRNKRKLNEIRDGVEGIAFQAEELLKEKTEYNLIYDFLTDNQDMLLPYHAKKYLNMITEYSQHLDIIQKRLPSPPTKEKVMEKLHAIDKMFARMPVVIPMMDDLLTVIKRIDPSELRDTELTRK